MRRGRLVVYAASTACYICLIVTVCFSCLRHFSVSWPLALGRQPAGVLSKTFLQLPTNVPAITIGNSTIYAHSAIRIPFGNIFEAVDKNNGKEREGKTRIAATFRSTRRALRALSSRHITFRLRCRIHDDSLIRNPPYLKAPSWGIKNPGVQGLGWGTTWAQPDITSGSNAGHY